jgi:hypothetical protein
VLGQELANERLARACRTDDKSRSFSPLDHAHERRAGLLDRRGGQIPFSRRRRGERTVREAKKALVHGSFP